MKLDILSVKEGITLHSIIQLEVHHGTTIYSDTRSWSGYNGPTQIGYLHEVVKRPVPEFIKGQ